MKQTWANSLKNSHSSAHSRFGFTIVELLIVIVIIAILAAVTVVAYNGVQKRAQQSRLASEVNSIGKKLMLHSVDNTAFPQSISDCPTPAPNNLCLTPSTDESYRYAAFAPPGTGYLMVNNYSYELTIFGDSQFLYSSNAERRGGKEFMQYTDLAPIIDRYGLNKYELSFDIKSANTDTKSTVNVYFQNGSTAKYGGLSINVPVTTSYTHHVLTFTPVLNDSAVAQAMLAFYGVYGTGNMPTVKNLQVKLAP